MRARNLLLPALLAGANVSAAGCTGKGDNPYFDRTSPFRVIAVVPAEDATGVSVGIVVEAEFGAEVDQTEAESSFSLLDAANVPVIGVPSYAAGILRFDPAPVLASGAVYTAVIAAGVPDALGRPLPEKRWSFTTGVEPPPTVVTALTPDPARLLPAPQNFVVRIAFSEPLAGGTLPAGTVQVVQSNGAGVVTPLAGAVSYDVPSRAILFKPTGLPLANQTVKVTMPGTVLDSYGRSVGPIPTWKFTTGATQDPTRPVLGGAPVGAETPAGSGTVVVTLPAGTTDADWSDAELVYEVTVSRRRASLPPPACNDSFDPRTFRAAELGSNSTLTLSRLENGVWDMVLEAEDGSGRRSLTSAPAQFTVTAGSVIFDPAIRTILDDSCALTGCHDGPNDAGGLDLSGTRDSIANAVSSFTGLKQVEPFCLERSYLYRKIEAGYAMDGGLMPPRDIDVNNVSREGRARIKGWIEQGAN